MLLASAKLKQIDFASASDFACHHFRTHGIRCLWPRWFKIFIRLNLLLTVLEQVSVTFLEIGQEEKMGLASTILDISLLCTGRVINFSRRPSLQSQQRQQGTVMICCTDARARGVLRSA